MPASPLTDKQLERRRHLRRVACRARENGWRWADNHGGWWRPDGVLVLVEALFRSTDPLDFLLEGDYDVQPSLALPAAPAGQTAEPIDGDYRALPAPPEGGES
jgi:hypothetical protein